MVRVMTQTNLPGLVVAEKPTIDQTHAQDKRLLEAVLGDFAWSDVYQALLQDGWPWRKAAYIAWSSLPSKQRQPETLAEFANTIGLSSSQQIRIWRSKNPAIDATVLKLSQAHLMSSGPDIVDSLIASATNPSYKNAPDRRVALEMMQLYTPRKIRVDETVTADESDLSDEELRRRAGMDDTGGES